MAATGGSGDAARVGIAESGVHDVRAQVLVSLRRRAEPEHRSTNLVVGSAVHAALASYYLALRDGEEPGHDKVVQHYQEAFDHDARQEAPLLLDDGEAVGQVRASGDALVRAFLDNVQSLDRVLAVEQAVRANIVDPDTGEVLEEQLPAYLDAVVEVDGKLVVLEHKTAARAWSQDQLDFDL